MQAFAERTWGVTQEHLRSLLDPDTYNLWFAPLHPVSLADGTLVLEVANDFCEVWLKDNYMGLLQDVVALAIETDQGHSLFLATREILEDLGKDLLERAAKMPAKPQAK